MTERYLTTLDLNKIATLSEPRFSPDGRWLAYVHTRVDRETNGYKSAIWRVPASGGRPRQFTSGDKRDSSPRWSPDGRWLAFISNRGDDEAKAQIYLIPTDGGEALRVTEMEQDAGELAWSPDGTQIAFTTRLSAQEMAAENEAGHKAGPEDTLDPDEIKRRAEEKKRVEEAKTDPRIIDRFAYRAETSFYDDRTKHIHVVEVDPETGQARGKPRRLTADERNYRQPRWMPDGGSLLATVDRKPGVDDLFCYEDVVRVPVDGGAPELLTGPDNYDNDPRPSPDGQWIAFNSVPVDSYTTANIEITLTPASGGEPQTLTTELDNHAVEFSWTPDSQSLCFLVPDRGRLALCRVSIEGGPVETLLSADREIQAYHLSADGQKVGFVVSTDRAPSDLYIANVDGTDEQQLTEVNAGWLASRTLGQVEDLWFESTDGTPIQGWIIKPPEMKPGQRYPLILSIHGGPHLMWSRHNLSMWHEWHTQAASGYVVFACNPRGSDGYGREFRVAATNHWGEADLPDLLTGVEKVIAQGYVDPQRLAITGGSYGGFMTAWAIGHDDRFKAAVAQRGVYDLTSFYSTSDVPRLTEWEFDSTPWENPQHLWKYSPLAYVENMHTPLLLIHSESDYRAPIPAAEGLFVALRRLKRVVEMVRYPREGHELSRSGEPKHRVDRLERIVGWLDRYVKEPTESQ